MRNRFERSTLKGNRRWLALQRLGQHVLHLLLKMRDTQAPSIGCFQNDGQSVRGHVLRLFGSKVRLQGGSFKMKVSMTFAKYCF